MLFSLSYFFAPVFCELDLTGFEIFAKLLWQGMANEGWELKVLKVLPVFCFPHSLACEALILYL